MSSYDKPKDFIQRGEKDPFKNKNTEYASLATFLGSRFIAPYVQYGFLKHDWGRPLIRALGGTTLPQGPPLITNTPLDRLGLSPYRTILWTMSVGLTLKHNYWRAVIMQEQMTPDAGLYVGLGNLACDTLNSLFFVCAETSASTNGEHFPQTPLIVGSILYTAGLLIELISEQQRYNFKKDPANKGKLYTEGLFGLSRHINYFGYTLFRGGYALAAGGWLWAGAFAGFLAWNLTQNAIPPHQEYLEQRYGSQFEQYKKKTPYVFAPLIY